MWGIFTGGWGSAIMGITFDPYDRWIDAKDLRALLLLDTIKDDDELHINSVGNLLIVRNGESVGYIDIPFANIELWERNECGEKVYKTIGTDGNEI